MGEPPELASRPRKVQKVESFVQQVACREFQTEQRGRSLPSSCMACASRDLQPEEACRFLGFRRLTQGSAASDKLELDGFHPGDEEPPDLMPRRAFYKLRPGSVEELMSYVAQALQPVIEQELSVFEAAETPVVRRYPRHEEYVTCDVCQARTLFSTYLCTVCAMELCIDCFKERRPDTNIQTQCGHVFQACCLSREEDLRDIQKQLTLRCNKPLPTKVEPPLAQMGKRANRVMENAQSNRTVPEIRPTDDALFRLISRLAFPAKVNMCGVLDRTWSVDDFKWKYGDRPADVVTVAGGDDQTPRIVKSTIGEYLTRWATAHDGAEKIEAWPPGDIQATLRDSGEDLETVCNMLPFPMLTSPRGISNLLAHEMYAVHVGRVPQPDPGPRLHFSTADSKIVISSSLHVDLTSSIHVLLNSGESKPRSEEAGIKWTVFLPEDVPILCNFLQERHPVRTVNMLSLQQCSLASGDVRLVQQRGARPFLFTQRSKEAVYISAGCVYQIENRVNTMRLVSDFIESDPLRLPHLQQLSATLRAERAQDVLQLKTLLWHTWLSVDETANDHRAQQRSKLFEASRPPPLLAPELLPNKGERYRNIKELQNAARQRMITAGFYTAEEWDAWHYIRCPFPQCRDLGFSKNEYESHRRARHGSLLTEDTLSRVWKQPKEKQNATLLAAIRIESHEERRYTRSQTFAKRGPNTRAHAARRPPGR